MNSKSKPKGHPRRTCSARSSSGLAYVSTTKLTYMLIQSHKSACISGDCHIEHTPLRHSIWGKRIASPIHSIFPWLDLNNWCSTRPAAAASAECGYRITTSPTHASFVVAPAQQFAPMLSCIARTAGSEKEDWRSACHVDIHVHWRDHAGHHLPSPGSSARSVMPLCRRRR
jgi:hypothetical protein